MLNRFQSSEILEWSNISRKSLVLYFLILPNSFCFYHEVESSYSFNFQVVVTM